jgi:beta-ribofuranosylaminobenzene 5'-phosphate synthase
MNIQIDMHPQSLNSQGLDGKAVKVIVTCCARLHMGFFDLNGSTGRMFGSLGVAINAPCTQLEITKSAKMTIEGVDSHYLSKKIEKIVNSLKITHDISQDFSVKIIQSIPQHTGLGSGTQMALALGAGLNRLFNLGLTVPQIAALTQRGSRSGIGIGTFEFGGLVVDGGRGNADSPPPIIARHDFPESWPILLIIDSAEQGAHGEHELMAFDALPKAGLEAAQTLAHSLLMQALPALVERDYAAFSRAIYKLQQATGEYFAPAQGGIFKSKSVAEVLNYLYQNNVLCAGQSSWGPTGFAVFQDDLSANATLSVLQQKFSTLNNISFQLVRGNNSGATIQLG